MTDLHLDWCSYDAAKYACERWHYSGGMPAGKTCKIGVWEDEQFIGVVVYNRGNCPYLGHAYDLDHTELAVLARIALDKHETPVSRIGAISLKLLQRKCPGLRLVVTYADPAEGHLGGIYKAMNWVYVGRSEAREMYRLDGKIIHSRRALQLPKHVRERAERIEKPSKYKYVYPLDDEIRDRIQEFAKPYPDEIDQQIIKSTHA